MNKEEILEQIAYREDWGTLGVADTYTVDAEKLATFLAELTDNPK